MKNGFTKQVGKSRRRINGAAAGLFVSVAASAAAIASPAQEQEPRELPRAEIFKPIGIAPELLESDAGDAVRVAIVLDRQPVLEETTKPGFEGSLSGYTRGDLQRAAQRNPERVSDLEADAAQESERHRTEVVSELHDEVAEIEEAQAPVERAVERAGGEVASSDLVATGALAVVSAKVGSGDLEELAGRDDVQAIIPAPKQDPELDTSTTTIGAASIFAQHSGGGDDGFGGTAMSGRTSRSGWTATRQPRSSRVRWDHIDNRRAIPGSATAPQRLVSSPPAMPLTAASRPGSPRFEDGGADDWAAPDPVEARNESFGSSPLTDHDANVADLSADTFLVPWAASAGNRNDDRRRYALARRPPAAMRWGGTSSPPARSQTSRPLNEADDARGRLTRAGARRPAGARSLISSPPERPSLAAVASEAASAPRPVPRSQRPMSLAPLRFSPAQG